MQHPQNTHDDLNDAELLLYPAFEQVRLLVQMPGWVQALTDGRLILEHGADNIVLAIDAQAHVHKITAEKVTDTCRRQPAANSPVGGHDDEARCATFAKLSMCRCVHRQNICMETAVALTRRTLQT
jgi:hypothetical protein